MKMTYTKSQFEVPDGKYTAKFLGVTMREDKPGDKPRLGDDGKPLPPAMTWDFEIQDEPNNGKKVDKLTGRIPTPKSGCGKMLVAITDAVPKDGFEFDSDQFVGVLYRITVVENRVSDNPGPVRLYGEQRTTSAVQTPQAAPRPPAPPRPPAKPTPGEKLAHDVWDVWGLSGAWEVMTTDEVRAWMQSNLFGPEAVTVKPSGADEADAKMASEFGFKQIIPF